jgi:lactate dehydrogenase-like 2-hydroxyacid dehydrogenase
LRSIETDFLELAPGNIVNQQKPDVLVIGSFPQATMDELARRFTPHHHRLHPLPPEAIGGDVAAAVRAVATEANRGASRGLIAILPQLEIISVFGVGLDLVDLQAARERNIPVSNTPGIIADEVADLAIGLMLASARQILIADRFVRDGRWANGPIHFGRSVGGKTLGVLGLGGIGRAIADRAAAFRMRVLYSGPRKKADAPYEYVADAVELARESDFLMVACKGGPETRHLVSAAVIDALGPQGTLINVARGSVVDEPALIAALKEGRLGFAALDVFDNEPSVSPALLALPNVIVQPHHGTATTETRARMGQLMIDNVSAKFAGRPLLTLVG